MKKLKWPLGAAWILLAFNLWHNSIRGVWNFSVKDSLTIGGNVMPLAESIDPKIRSYKPYDGQFYYAMAFDPFLISGENLKYIDVPMYRCKRLLYPLLAWMLSFNNPTRLPSALLLANLGAWVLIGFTAYKIAQFMGLPRSFLVFTMMTLTGLTFSVFRTLTEPWGFALALGGCFLWETNKPAAAIISFSLAGLAREAMLFIPVSIFLYEVVFRKQKPLRISLTLFASFVPLALWSAYLKWRLPPQAYNDLRWISLPLIGFARESWLAFQFNTTSTELQRSVSLIVVTLWLTGAAIWSFMKTRSFWGWLALTQGILSLSVHGDIWNYHASSCRVVIPLMAFCAIIFLEQKPRHPGL